MANVFACLQINYQFQEEDGDQNNATLLGSLDTPLTRLVSTNSNIQLRIRINENGAGNISGATTDDYQLQRSIAGGAFANVTTTSTGARCNTSSQVVDGGSATPRLGAAANGIADDQNGICDNIQLAGNSSMELVWGLTLVAADLAEGNALTFQVLLNGALFTAITGGGYTVTPQLNITKAVSFTGAPGAGSTIVTGFAPTVTAGVGATLEPGVGTAAITGFAPTWSGIQPDFTGEPAAGSLTLAGLAPTVAADVTAEPTTAAVSVIGYAPDVPQGLTERLTPNTILASSNLKDTLSNIPPTRLADIDEPTGSDDGEWWTAVNPNNDIDIRLGFPTSSGNLVGTQSIRVLIRGTSLPSRDVRVDLYESGAPAPGSPTVYVTEAVGSVVGQVVTMTFQPTDITDQTGAGVEVRIRAIAA